MSIGARIKCLRKAKNLNQTELGEMLGLNFGAISAMESDRSMPRTETVLKMCEIFKVSSDYLLFGRETEKTISESEQEIIEILRKDDALTSAIKEAAELKKKVIRRIRMVIEPERLAA